MDAIEVKNTSQDILNQRLLPNFFGLFYTCEGYRLKEPCQADYDFDIADFSWDKDFWMELREAVIFPDFEIDEEISDLTLIRNEKLGITLSIVNVSEEVNFRFIEADTIGELINKFPDLKQYVLMPSEIMIEKISKGILD